MSNLPRLHRAALCVLAGLVAASLSACGGDSDGGSGGGAATASTKVPAKPESRSFRLGTQPWIGYGPFTLAQEQGIFEREGLDVEITNFKEDRQINAAIASKRLDGVNASIIQALTFAQANLRTKVVLIEDISREADAILAGPDIASVADLRGKKVAYEEGTTGEVLLRYALKEHGLTMDDIEKVPIAATEAGPAIISGRVDAAYTYEPFVTSAQQDGNVRALFTAGERPGLIADALIVRAELLDEEPGKVGAMVRAWHEAVTYYRENTEPAQAAIARDLGAEPSELTEAFDGITFYDAAENSEQLASGELVETVGVVADLMREAGLLQGDVDVESIIDSRFVDAAAR